LAQVFTKEIVTINKTNWVFGYIQVSTTVFLLLLLTEWAEEVVAVRLQIRF